MIPRATIPASTGQKVHNTPAMEGGAVDIYAPQGSNVLAPGRGRVVDVLNLSTQDLPGWQIRGFMTRPDGLEVPFVIAHLQEGSFPRAGATFRKKEVIGSVQYWRSHPRSTHAHWSFRRAGTKQLPPPGNVKVLGVFTRFGPMN